MKNVIIVRGNKNDLRRRNWPKEKEGKEDNRNKIVKEERKR